MAADEPNALLFAQTHFTKAVNYVGLSGELFDANHRTGFDMRKRAGRRFGATFRRRRLILIRFLHCSEVSLVM